MRLVTSSRRRPASLNAAAAEIVATVLVHVSFWLLFLSMFAIRVEPFVLAILALLPVFLYLISRLKGIGGLMPVYAVFLPLLAGLLGMKYFLPGIKELFNYGAKAINEIHDLAVFPTGSGYPKSDVPGLPAELVLLLLGFLFAGLFAFAICRKVRALAIPLAVVPVFIAFLTGLRPTMPAFIFYLVSATFYLILLETRSKGTARRLTWLNGEISAALLLFLVLLALTLAGFEHSEKIEDLRREISASVTSFRYAPDESVDRMPGGDLNAADEQHYTDKTVLTVETPNAFPMYLRGFSGDLLENGKWTPLDSHAYFDDYSLTGPWVRNRYFSPALSLGQLLDLKWQVQTTQYEKGERDTMSLPRYPVTIRNELAFSDRLYAPYEVSAESKGLRRAELSQEGLFAEGIKGKRTYELTVYQPLTKDYGNVRASSIIGEDAPYNSLYEDEFVPAEKVYRAFVQKNEKEVPEPYRELLEELTPAVLGSATKDSDAVLRIRSYFARNYTYSLNIPAPAGEDPVLRFLETRTGYCAHFATLATLLLRQAGYPARYAEGYYVSDKLLKDLPKETEVTVAVPDSAAHAWVELYKEGVGWVPVEVTPGYFETGNDAKNTGTSPKETRVEPEVVPEEQQSEEPGEDEEVPTEDPQEPPEESHFRAWILLLPLLLILLLIPLVYDRIQRKRIESAADEVTVAFAYRYLMRVFRLLGLDPDPLRPKDLAPLMGERKGDYLHLLDLLYKETYSVDGLTQAERETACDTVLDLTSDLKLLRGARKQLREKTKKQTEAPHGK